MAVAPVPGHRAEDFDPGALAAAKAKAGLTISVCLPARDEATTVGTIVASVRRELVERSPLVDEIVLIDDGSTDGTAEAAAREGARVLQTGDILPDAGPGSGKGNAMWKSLYVCEGDVICWVDADIRNFVPHFVTGLVGPLVARPEIGFAKAFYRRPHEGRRHGGGRVTELVARPLISHLFPQLARFVQPLAGEYAGRRVVLDSVPFVEGWGVELGLLVDIVERFGLAAVAQVDLGVREHRNREVAELAPQSMAILVTALRRAGLVHHHGEVERLVRFTDVHDLEVVDVEVRERPPMRSLPAYRAKFGLELSA